jgi:ligand-binding SRPBCC domain-containing protein
MLIEHMASGLSYESFAGVIGTHRDTLYKWEAAKDEKGEFKYPEFFDAKKEGSAKNLLYWEKVGHEGLWDTTEYNDDGKPIYKKSLNSTVWIFSMKNRHKWKDRQEVELDATVKTNPLKEDLKQKTTEELLEYMERTKGE